MRHTWILMALLLALSAGCNNSRQFEGECTINSECPVGAFCKGGLCACRSDEACGAGEECNSQNICQKRTGCRRNSECPDPAGTFCDIATGQCINKIVQSGQATSAGCGSNVHCDAGSVCDQASQTCVQGCFETADCPLYSICTRTSSTGLGSCDRGNCADNSFCEFGELCQNGSCVASSDPNHCAVCDNSQGSCGSTANFCLINANYEPNDPSQGSQFFCGVDCQNDPSVCPNGYNCGLVRILTSDLCDRDMHSQCCAGGDPAECCPDGAAQCEGRRFCSVGGESDVRGACTCLRNEDCEIRPEAPATCLMTCGGLGIRGCFQDSDCAALPCQPGRNVCQWPQGRMCTGDQQCDPLPLCVNPQGAPNPFCIWSEPGAPVACQDSADCLCIQPAGTCFGTGRPCSTGADCTQLTCSGGACIIGASCSPIDGVTCEDLR